jgi:hypothetical protein
MYYKLLWVPNLWQDFTYIYIYIYIYMGFVDFLQGNKWKPSFDKWQSFIIIQKNYLGHDYITFVHVVQLPMYAFTLLDIAFY